MFGAVHQASDNRRRQLRSSDTSKIAECCHIKGLQFRLIAGLKQDVRDRLKRRRHALDRTPHPPFGIRHVAHGMFGAKLEQPATVATRPYCS